jgi:hypothetical protein
MFSRDLPVSRTQNKVSAKRHRNAAFDHLDKYEASKE